MSIIGVCRAGYYAIVWVMGRQSKEGVDIKARVLDSVDSTYIARLER